MSENNDDEIRTAGDRVEVVDPTHRLAGRAGTVEFFVRDNVCVRFDDVWWLPKRMVFVDQLRLVTAAEQTASERPVTLLRRVRMSLAKMFL
jgi:hypothetical protein